MVDFVTGLRCRECQRAFPAEALHVCDYCFGPLEVAYDYERIADSISRERRQLWHFRHVRPLGAVQPGAVEPGRLHGLPHPRDEELPRGILESCRPSRWLDVHCTRAHR